MADAGRNEDLAREVVDVEWVQSLSRGDFTYKDYKNWPEDFRVELIDGMVYLMASGDDWHQWLTPELSGQIRNHLLGKKCLLYTEFDVRLFYESDESDKTVVRPDIIVVCDRNKSFGKKNCQGAPDFVIEILSDSSEGRDFIDKKKVYKKAGVKEYWVVSKEAVHIFILVNGQYEEKVVTMHKDLKQPVYCLEDCVIDFQPVVAMRDELNAIAKEAL